MAERLATAAQQQADRDAEAAAKAQKAADARALVSGLATRVSPAQSQTIVTPTAPSKFAPIDTRYITRGGITKTQGWDEHGPTGMSRGGSRKRRHSKSSKSNTRKVKGSRTSRTSSKRGSRKRRNSTS